MYSTTNVLNATARLESAAIALAERRWRAEIELARLAISKPADAVPLIRELGVGCEHFSQDDTSAIFAAAILCHDRPELDVIEVCEIGLKHWHCWDETQIVGNLGAMLWSRASLAAFVMENYFVRAVTRHAAGKLLDVCRRESAARACWQRAIDLAEFRADPDGESKPDARRGRVVMMAIRRHGRGAA